MYRNGKSLLNSMKNILCCSILPQIFLKFVIAITDLYTIFRRAGSFSKFLYLKYLGMRNLFVTDVIQVKTLITDYKFPSKKSRIQIQLLGLDISISTALGCVP